MKYILILFFYILALSHCFSQCNNIPIDLNSWSSQGGNWDVAANGTSVNQTVNGPAVYFLSPQEFINVQITGTLRTNDGDDDQMGFVFGVEGTIGVGNFNYFLFQWDEGGLGNGMYIREYNQTGLIATHLSLPGNHWTRGVNHNFTLTYKSSNVVVAMDDVQVMDIDGCFNPGKFGFYNQSQANVTYSNFQYLPTSDFIFTSPDEICIYDQAATDVFCLNGNTNPYNEIRWDFGDGTIIPNVTNAQHTYSSAGNYTIELYVRDFGGCEDSVSKTIRVFDPAFTLGPDQTICPGAFDATFTSSNTNTGNAYNWSSGETTPSITKNTTGQYRLTLTDVNGCIDKDTVNLVVGTLPTVDFTAASKCLYDSVDFTNNTQGGQSYFWDFGDGNTSTVTSPKHKYTSTGNFNIKLVTNFPGGCSDSITKSITIFDVPNAEFIGNDDCFNINAVFTNQSTIASGVIANNIWDFGDGSANGTQINENHNYGSARNYIVSLITISNNLCVDTISKTFSRHAIPSIDFNFSNKCAYDTIEFTNLSTIVSPSVFQSFEWDFNDGNTSNLDNIKYKYNSAGNYNVKLVGTTQFGCKDSVSKQITAFSIPSAAFIFNNDCENENAIFNNQSNIANGTITNWDWTFGDGKSGTNENESNLYLSDGDYQVQLVVTSNNNCKDTVKNTITRFPLPEAQFNANPECLYNEVLFNNNSTIEAPDAITNFNWTFSSGATSTDQSPSVLFNTPGTNTAKLVLTSNNGCMDSITKNIEIFNDPIANFSPEDGCNDTYAPFIDNSTVAVDIIDTWKWDLGDGTTSTNQNLSHLYNAPGTYIIELVVITQNGCSDTTIRDIERYPIPNASFTSTDKCLNEALEFRNESTITTPNFIINYSWNFGDGSIQDNNENTLHQYTNAGIYQASLTVTSHNGCTDDTTRLVEVFPVPQVNFTTTNKCINLGAAEFDNLSIIESGTFDQWEWEFGDGGNSQLLHPNHIYNVSGTYNVQLVGISNYFCSDTVVLPIMIYNKPTANFIASQTENCIPFCSQFTDNSTDNNNISTWEWKFEGQDDSFTQSPEICFTTEGNFDVSLIVTNNEGCKDTLTELSLISAWPNPIADFQLSQEITDVINPFITITNNSFDAEKWTWNLGNGTLDTSNYDIKETYDKAGSYTISLNVENQYGCKDSTEKILTVTSKSFHYVPNSFSPNGDGINDGFKIEHEDFNFSSITIYDRWGKEIYSTTDIEQPWDGTFNGKQLKTATFVWVLKYIDKDGGDQAEKGSVTLVK